MSKFFSKKYTTLEAYTPGEQPQDQQYVKLNTNESPFPPAPAVVWAAAAEAERLQLYSDPESYDLTRLIAERYGVAPENVLVGNGSDELLNFAFAAWGDREHPFVFPDITYGFYPVFARVNGVPFREIPLREGFALRVKDFCGVSGNVVIANPNAPTGLALGVSELEEIIASNPEHVVVIDEAYVDFGAESCVPLTKKYDNLLVVQTFSKSRSLAGGRLGFAIGHASLIQDLNTLKYSTNPYNVNRMTAACGAAALREEAYYTANAAVIQANRIYTALSLKARGFTVLQSQANFLVIRPEFCAGEALYLGLKERGVLIRHWNRLAIRDWCRVTIGTMEQMEAFLAAVDDMMQKSNEE